MTAPPVDPSVTCSACGAWCCRQEVLLVGGGDVPEEYTEPDGWGGTRMARLDDGWCAALDRESMSCGIYDERPWGCRELAMGGPDCLAARAAAMPPAGTG